MLFYISIFIASLIAALLIVYLFHTLSGIFHGASSIYVSGARDNQKTYRRRTPQTSVKRTRDKSTPWGWGNSTSSAKAAGMYSASSHVASAGAWSTTTRDAPEQRTSSGNQKASGFDSFLKNSTAANSSAANSAPAVKANRRTRSAPWGW